MLMTICRGAHSERELPATCIRIFFIFVRRFKSLFLASSFLIFVSVHHLDSQDHRADIDANDNSSNKDILSEARRSWPEFLSSHARVASAFQDTVDYRRNLVLAAKIGDPSRADSVIVAYENWSLGVGADSISVSALLCPRAETIGSLEGAILTMLKNSGYQVGSEWNEVGFLRAQKDSRGLIFNTPVQFESVLLVIKVDTRLSDGNGVVTVIYEIKAGPRQNDRKSFEDKTSEPESLQYITSLVGSLKHAVEENIASHCTRLNSGRQLSRRVALETINPKLSAAQQDQLRIQVTHQQ